MTSNIPYSLVERDGQRTLTVLVDGEMWPITDINPQFDEILRRVRNGDRSFVDLVDIARAVSAKLESLSERLTLKGSTLYFDGVEVEDAFAETLVRFFNDGVEDWKPLAAYYEKVYTNMEPHSRDNLSRWVKAANLTITSDGNILAYKGVIAHGTDDEGNPTFRSCSSGHGFVDGKEFVNSYLVQKVGSVVTMPRNEVTHDPDQTCSSGLHAGTHSYAQGYGDTLLRVIINPRDVVSVPTDCEGQKVRVSRYVVDSVSPHVVESPVYGGGADYSYDLDDDDEENEDYEDEIFGPRYY